MAPWGGIAAVFGGFLIHLSLGTFFTIGNLTPFIISYLRHRSHLQVTLGHAIWINALSYVGQGGLMAVGGLVEKRIGARWTCLFGGTIFCGSIAFSSLTIEYSFILFALTYGLFSCLGLGIAYIAPISLGMKWFPERKGLSNGIILSGYGLGALVFGQVQTAFLNPQNKSPDVDGYFSDHDILDRTRVVFFYLAAIYGAFQLVGIALLFPVPSDKKVTESSIYVIEDAAQSYPKGPELSPDTRVMSLATKKVNPCQMLRYKEFYMLWGTFALHSQCIQFVNTYYKSFGQGFISDDRYLTLVGSLASACNCLGRIFWGQIQDRTSYKTAMLWISAILSLLMFTFILTPQGGKIMFTFWVVTIYFSFSGIFPLMPTAGALAFGPKHAGTNFGVLFTAPAISSIIGAVIIQLILNQIGWLGIFCTIGGFTAAGKKWLL